MNCRDVAHLVPAYADGETDRLQSRSVSRHLRTCAQCAAEHERILRLREGLKAQAPYFDAPPALRAAVLAQVERDAADAPRRGASNVGRWQWLTAGAFAGSLATMLAWFVGTALIDGRATDARAADAVNAHVRATLGNHLIAVASSDQHTVKPWLSARLDFAVPVRDFTADGFELAGARLEYLDGRPVAALVYRYRLHMIDVFVRPQSSRAVPAGAQVVRGFNAVFATGHGMEWMAVSDANSEALTRLVTLLAQGSP